MDQRIIIKIKKYFNKDYSYLGIIQRLNKKYNIKISSRTLLRILSKNKLRRKNVTESPVEEIALAIILELTGSGRVLGYRSMWKRLRRQYNLTVKQKTVMLFMKVIDSEGVEGRSRYRLKRRCYETPGPNHIWHADGYDKLKRFGFAIYGFIDGFSRKVLSLDVATTNNDPDVIGFYYLKLVEKYGFLPTFIRTDHGTEVGLMEDCHMALRLKHSDENAGTASFLKGRSTHNQRIESYWRQLRQHMSEFYIFLFKKMEDLKLVDVDNPVNIEFLRFCFGKLIKQDLVMTRKEWNEHKIRAQNCVHIVHGKPNEMFHLPEDYRANDQRKCVDLNHVRYLLEKYAKEPMLYSSTTEELVKMFTNSKQPTNAEEAFNLYVYLIDKYNLNIHNI